jgi:predicted Zn-dependent peptidase
MRQFKLKNGIRVIIVPLHTQLTYISVNYLFGRYKEKRHEAGLTHYCEHLLGCLTSQKYKSSVFVSDEIYKRGGEFNAYVSDYEMSIYIKGLYDDLAFYMDILSNTINDFYVEDDVKIKEKSIVIQEYLGYISNSNYRFSYNMFKYLYPKYSYMADYHQQMKDIATFDDKKISAYMKKHLNTDNLVLSISCPSHKVNETAANVQKYFGVLRYKKTTSVYPVIQHSNRSLKIVNIRNINADKNNSFVIHLAKRIEYLSDEYFILYYYLQRILFHFDSGIFYKILRKKLGIIYNIGLYVQVDYHNPELSYYNITSRCHSKYTMLFIDNFLHILNDYEIEDERIENAKRHFKYLYENTKFHNLSSDADDFKWQVLFHKDILTNKEIYEKTLSISSSQIKEYYKNVFVKDILAKHIFFYYSNKNVNKQILSLYTKQMPRAECKTHYIP